MGGARGGAPRDGGLLNAGGGGREGRVELPCFRAAHRIVRADVHARYDAISAAISALSDSHARARAHGACCCISRPRALQIAIAIATRCSRCVSLRLARGDPSSRDPPPYAKRSTDLDRAEEAVDLPAR